MKNTVIKIEKSRCGGTGDSPPRKKKKTNSSSSSSSTKSPLLDEESATNQLKNTNKELCEKLNKKRHIGEHSSYCTTMLGENSQNFSSNGTDVNGFGSSQHKSEMANNNVEQVSGIL